MHKLSVRMLLTLVESTRYVGVLCVFLACALGSRAEDETPPRFLWSERVLGTVNDLGAVTKLDNSVGWNFNPHVGVDVGLPVYFVRPSSSTATTGYGTQAGLGNLYVALRLTAAHPEWSFLSTLTGFAPTGDRDRGFSTGHAGVDWSNYLDHSFGRLRPFANVGLGNTITDTPFFIRPFTSHGVVGHFEGGTFLRLIPRVSAGASVYAIEASGAQTLVSRVVSARSAAGVRNQGQSHGPFGETFETRTVAEAASDRGGSVWLMATPSSHFDFVVGYSRSAKYDFNSVFFGIGINVRSLARIGMR